MAPARRACEVWLVLALILCTGLRAQEDSFQDEGLVAEGCLVLDGPAMHEFGSELAFLHVGLGGCADMAGQEDSALTWLLDGEELGRMPFYPETVRLTMPLGVAAGPHELAVSLRATRANEEVEQVLDEAVWLFFISDFRPEIVWEFPPEGYVFKRNSQRFLRFSVHDAGDQMRCQEGAASCAGPEPLVYHATYYLNGQLMGADLRQIYMLGLSGLDDGDYEALVVLADKHKQPMGVEHRVRFSVRLTDEYLDDGSLPDAVDPITPCPTDESGSCTAGGDSSNGGDCRGEDFDCGSHGSVVGGVCRCIADYIGDHCEHHLLSSLACGKAREWERAALQVYSRLNELQHLSDDAQCGNASRVAVVRLRGTNGHAGLASFVEQVSGALNGALRNGSMAYLQDFCDYFYHRACPRRSTLSDDLSCYFNPLFSGCAPHQTHRRSTEVLEHFEDWRPLPEFAPLGIFWWNAQLLRYIFAPNARLQGMVRAAKSAMGFRHPILGVHVRRGDSCKLKALPGYGMPLASCKTFGDFMPHIRNFSALYGVKTVYVTSDSASVYQEVAEFQGADGLTFVHTSEDRSYYEHDWLLEMRLRMSLVDRKLVADSTIVDTLLLSSCDYLILGLQSGYSRLALALAAAAKGYVPPYVSMDYPWMPRFGMTGPRPPWKEWWQFLEKEPHAG